MIFREETVDTAEIEWISPLSRNDIRLELATLLEPNHKMIVTPQTWFCFVRKTLNQNEAKWTLPLFENVKGKSSPKWIRPKILKKVDTLFLVLETLLTRCQVRLRHQVPRIKYPCSLSI